MSFPESSSDEFLSDEDGMDWEEREREIKFQQDLKKSLNIWYTRLVISHDVARLSKEMQKVVLESQSRGRYYVELDSELSQILHSDQLQLQSYNRVYLAIRESFESVKERGYNFQNKFHQLVLTKEATWKEFEAMDDDDVIENETRKDPEEVIKKLEESSRKVLEVKACFKNLKAEWKAMKQSFNADLDCCIRRIEALLHVVQREMLGPGEE